MGPLSMKIIIKYLIKVTTMQGPRKSLPIIFFWPNDSHENNTVKPQKYTT